MSALRTAIVDYLRADATLLALLPVNDPWLADAGITPGPKWSILPADRITAEALKPLLAYTEGTDTLVGYNLLEDFFYLRCYNGNDKTFVTIDAVLSRVKVLLHRHRFTFADGSVCIEFVYESTSEERYDPGYELPYREARYKCLRI